MDTLTLSAPPILSPQIKALLQSAQSLDQSPSQSLIQPPGQAPQPPATANGPPAMPSIQDRITMLTNNLPGWVTKDCRVCAWRCESRGSGKPAKVPYDPRTGQHAKVSDPDTFGSYDDAMQALSSGQYDGIGILVEKPLVALDIDNVIDDQGDLSPMASDICNMMSTAYQETSPSGRGIRILFKVSPDFVFDSDKFYINRQAIGLEVYVAGYTAKYVSITGNRRTPNTALVDAATELQVLLDKYMRRDNAATPVAADPAPPAATTPQPSPMPPTSGPKLSDAEVLQRVRQGQSGDLFDALYVGDMSAYGNDHSKADLAFCNMLARQTKDPEQIDEIIRTSGLMRPKWDSPRGNTTYGRVTIDNAIRTAIQYEMQHRAAAVTTHQPQLNKSLPIPASDLMKLTLPEPDALVEDMIYEGTTTILGGFPKAGKSWLALWLALAITTHQKFLGRETKQAPVIYAALEDSYHRLQSRLEKLLAGAPAPENLYLLISAPTLAEGLLEQLDSYLQMYPDTKLIIGNL